MHYFCSPSDPIRVTVMAEDIKEKILSTAYALFRQRGVRDVTIDDICRSLSMSKKTFYQ